MQTALGDDVGDAVDGSVVVAVAEVDAERVRELVDELRPRDLLELAKAVGPERLGAELVCSLLLHLLLLHLLRLRLRLLRLRLRLCLWLCLGCRELHLRLRLRLRLRLWLGLRLYGDGERRAGDVAVDCVDPVACVLVAVSGQHDDTCCAPLCVFSCVMRLRCAGVAAKTRVIANDREAVGARVDGLQLDGGAGKGHAALRLRRLRGGKEGGVHGEGIGRSGVKGGKRCCRQTGRGTCSGRRTRASTSPSAPSTGTRTLRLAVAAVSACEGRQ